MAEICRSDFNLNDSKKIELLAGKNENGCPALFIACQCGHYKTVTALIAGICRADLNFNNDGKIEFAAVENKYCFSGLISAFISAISRGSRHLSKNPKAELLAGKTEEGYPALYIACLLGHLDVVTELVSAICSSDLSLSQSEKAELLAGKNAYGVSALEIARVRGYYKIVEVLRNCGM
ncbi:MAG: hypothetical protein QS748_06475 [Candidatus Endonucleobacter bathymodioli]|uniref:Ankyrin repeat protein n=1 Tax=Candidatus Endonucleibacter bathymodioli TaxID=539814 RepID=A0AA90NLM7_9GAMM|nr:hypothetical protein [Candidatus Endonucleobacter bathymodioli]